MLFSIFCLLKGVFFVVTMLHYLKKFFVAKINCSNLGKNVYICGNF